MGKVEPLPYDDKTVYSVAAFNRELTKREKEVAGAFFHYAMGVT